MNMSYIRLLKDPEEKGIEINKARIIRYTQDGYIPFEKWTRISGNKTNLGKLEETVNSLNNLLGDKEKKPILKTFNQSKRLYDILNEREDIKNGESNLIEGVYARNAVNLLGYYGKIVERKMENTSTENYKDISLHIDKVFDNSFNILKKRLNLMTKENGKNRMYSLIGQLVFNYALFNLKAKRGTKTIGELKDIKIGKVKLWKKMYEVNKDLLARFKIVLSDYYVNKREYKQAKIILGNVQQLTQEMRRGKWEYNLRRVRVIEGIRNRKVSLLTNNNKKRR